MTNPSNLCLFDGYICNDPKFYTDHEGKEFAAAFRLGVGRNFKNRKGEYKSDFIPCRYQGNMEFAHKLKKGDRARVACSYRQDDPYKDENGKDVYPPAYFLIESLRYQPKNQNGSDQSAGQTANQSENQSANSSSDQLSGQQDGFYDDDDFGGLPFN